MTRLEKINQRKIQPFCPVRSRVLIPVLLCIFLLLPWPGTVSASVLEAGSAPTAAARPAAWATSVHSQHLKNFYKIDDKVYRSAQPDRKGFRELREFGIRNVLTFRNHHADDAGKAAGLKLFRVKMNAGGITTDQVVAALRVIKQADGPILIHCWHGSDRTGLISALYRVVFQGWSKSDAIDELINGGYGFHSVYRNIPKFIEQVDVDELKKQVLQ